MSTPAGVFGVLLGTLIVAAGVFGVLLGILIVATKPSDRR